MNAKVSIETISPDIVVRYTLVIGRLIVDDTEGLLKTINCQLHDTLLESDMRSDSLKILSKAFAAGDIG
jgi:hypothetical protein